MLLVEFTINAALNRLSMEGIALTHWWKNKVVNFDPPQYSIAKPYGGYCKMTFGSISFSPDLFDNDWPPPINGAITIKYTATTEGAAETLFVGMAHLESINREEITYGLYGPSYDEIIADGVAYNKTVDAILTEILTGIAEINNLDTTHARAPSPNITHTTSGENLAIDLASDIAAFYTHLFYIIGNTAYLVDMLGFKNSATITEFDFFPASYPYKVPTSVARSGNFNENSAYPYGNELSVAQYHDNQAAVEACLVDILTLVHRPRVSLGIPFLGNLPNPGKKLSWTDASQGQSLDVDCYVRKIRYDFNNEIINIEGDAAISATP